MELSFHPDVELLMKVAENDSEQQIAQIQELIEQHVDVLIVAPNETEPLTEVVAEAFQAGIPIILVDRKINADQYSSYISANNYTIGKTAAEYLTTRFREQGKILELQIAMTISPAIERSRGFREGIAPYPQLEIVDELKTGGDISILQEQLPALLQQYPATDIVFCHTDFICQEAERVVREAGIQRDLFYLGVDGIPGNNGGLQAIEDGKLDATLLYPTGGTEAIQTALDILEGRTIDKRQTLQTTVIDERNVRIMKLQTNKILSQQFNIERQQRKLSDQETLYRNQRNVLYAVLGLLMLSLILGAIVLKTLQSRSETLKTLRHKNQEIEQQRNEIIAISEQAKAAHDSKLRFFTNISHEFRTPLTLILGTIDSLLQSHTFRSRTDQEDIGLMRKNALRLLRLINQVMDIRKMDNERMRVQAAESDLIEFVKAITKAFRKVAEQRQIDFRFFYKEEQLKVWFDPAMLDKVLFNLLSNAFKFTADGGKIHVAVEQNRIAQRAVIVVEDDGRGMSEEQLKHVFQRFYQGNNYNAKGSGLGLSLSKDFIELHGGTISVQSVPQAGSRFEIQLQLGQVHLRPEQIFKGDPNFTAGAYQLTEELPDLPVMAVSQKEQTLLLVEDNDDLQFFLSSKLREQFNIEQAFAAKKGWEIATEKIPDLIICDINLPDQNGLELTRRLKADLRTSHIPIILLTAQTAPEQKLAGVQSGADIYLTKPFDLTFLEENIRNLLRNRHRLRELFSQVAPLKEKTLAGLSPTDRQFLQQFIQFIAAHYSDQQLSMTALTEEFGLSRTQLYRKVKALMGKTVKDYIQEVRLTKARTLLEQEKLTIAEIAYQVGYTSPGYFSTAFKNYFDYSPSEVRGR